ncbi:MAG: hypothetical protein K6U04_15865 [Armatimonadetes bacterium]|nr:hypothetical protein [Armatimonadota bacterium]
MVHFLIPPKYGKRLKLPANIRHFFATPARQKKFFACLEATAGYQQTLQDVIRAIAEAIHFFGGVAPELVIARPGGKQGVL